MSQMKMSPEIKAQWVEALRSGDYKQGQCQLRTSDNTFCCLGVLTDLGAKAGIGEWLRREDGDWQFDGGVAYTPIAIAEWAGLPDADPFIKPVDSTIEESSLTGFNDSKELSFSEIADLIEEYL